MHQFDNSTANTKGYFAIYSPRSQDAARAIHLISKFHFRGSKCPNLALNCIWDMSPFRGLRRFNVHVVHMKLKIKETDSFGELNFDVF